MEMQAASSLESLPKSQSGGALKLLDDLDELASLLGTDISKPRHTKPPSTIIEEATHHTVTELSSVSSRRRGETFKEALASGRLNTLTGNYTDHRNSNYKLADALNKELINIDSAVFVNPGTQEVVDIQQAISHGYIQKTGHYIDPHSGKRLKLKECLERHIIVARDVEKVGGEIEESVENVVVPPLNLEGKQVVEVLDPSSQEWIPVSLAITRGIYDRNSERYFNSKTGELLSTQEAVNKNLVKLGSKMLDSSVDSNDTDVLLDGHMSGLKGFDINYSGVISSDDDDDRDDYLFTSSPRKDVPERPDWPRDGAQAIKAVSSQSVDVLTSGSRVEYNKDVDRSSETTPKFGSATEIHDTEHKDTTPDNELQSLGSNSSFVITQSITVHESTQAQPSQEFAEHSSRLLSMISKDETSDQKQQIEVETTLANQQFIMDDSGSTILTADTSEVTLNLSNLSSADTTQEEATLFFSPQPELPPPLYIPPPPPTESTATETKADDSSTASYHSSILDESDNKPPGDAVIQQLVPDSASNIETDSFIHHVTSKANKEVVNATEEGVQREGVERSEYITEQVDTVTDTFTSVSATTTTSVAMSTTTPASQSIATTAGIDTITTTTTTVNPADEIAPLTFTNNTGERDKTRRTSSTLSDDVFVGAKPPSQFKSPEPGKIASKVSPSIVSSLSKHLEAKQSVIARSDTPKSPSPVGSYRSSISSKSVKQRQESDSSPSLRQLSQQLAMEAVMQRAAIHGGMKPSERVASWKEKERKALSQSQPAAPAVRDSLDSKVKVSSEARLNDASPLAAEPKDTVSAGDQRETGNEQGKAGIADSQQALKVSSQQEGKGDVKKEESSQLLARVDAALETAGCDLELSSVQTSTTHQLRPVGKEKQPASHNRERTLSGKQKEPLVGKILEQFQTGDGKLHAGSKEGLDVRERTPSPNKIAKADPKSPSKVAFAYDPTIRKHKVTVYSNVRIISYEIGVKLGLINVKTGRFKDPVTGTTLSIRQACLQGLIDDKAPALTDLKTGKVWTLKECVGERLIDLDTGRISESRLKSLRISVYNSFIASLAIIPPQLTVMDAVKIGMLNPHTGQFRQSEDPCSLSQAVILKFIDGETTLVQDPNTHRMYPLSEALNIGLLNPANGDVLDKESGHMMMTFYGALLCGVYKAAFDAVNAGVVHPDNGQLVSVNEAIRSSLLGHDTCLVYDSDSKKQVSFDEALAGGLIDRPSSNYLDKQTGASLSCERAVQLGLIQPTGAEVCTGFNLSQCVETLYPSAPANKSTSSPSASRQPAITSSPPATISSPPATISSPPAAISSPQTVVSSPKPISKTPPPTAVVVTKGKSPPPTAMLATKSRSPVTITTSLGNSTSSPLTSTSSPLTSTTSPATSKASPVTSTTSPVTSKASHTTSGASSSISPTVTTSKTATKGYPSPVISPQLKSPSLASAALTSSPPASQSSPFPTLRPSPGPKGSVSHSPKAKATIPSPTSPKSPPAIQSTATSISELGTLKPSPKNKSVQQYKKQPVTETSIVAAKKEEVVKERPKYVDPTVTVTERVIAIESRRRPQLTAHSDNISATEYFTKGDIDVEIQAEDENPLDNYEIKLTNAEPQAFDWESLPISPLRERQIVVESKERSIPLRDKEIIIIEREEVGVDAETALELGYINYSSEEFTHPVSKENMPVHKALEKGYIKGSQQDVDAAINVYRKRASVMEYKITQEVAYSENRNRRGIPFIEAVDMGHIDAQRGTFKDGKSLVQHSLRDAIYNKLLDGESGWFTSPGTKRLFTISEAIDCKAMDAHGFWSSPLSGQKLPFAEGIAKGHICLLDPADANRCLLTQIKKFSVQHVIHPVSMEKIEYSVAVLEGIINTVEGVYKSPVTGDSLTIDEAISKRLISGVPLSTRVRRAALPEPERLATYTENRSYTITHAKHTVTGKTLPIGEARSQGILDKDLTTFTDLRSGKLHSIQEAIDMQYLVATLDDPKAPPSKGTHFVSTKVHNIDSVVNPRTKKVMSIYDAVKEGIIDEETGDYANLDENETLDMTAAIQKGLVKTRPLPTPVNDTFSFSITAVTDPNNGELLTVAEALRKGFLERGRKHFCNPLTRTVYTMNEAINNGWAHIKSNIETHGFSYGHQNQHSGFQTFTILSVKDVRQAQELPVAVAISQGILDSSKQKYRNNVTGEVINLDQAVKRNLIKLIPAASALGNSYGTITPSYQSTSTLYQQKALNTLQPPPQPPSVSTMQSRGVPQATTLSSVSDFPIGPDPPATVATTVGSRGEPVYSQINKNRKRQPSGTSQAPSGNHKPEPIDIYKANTRGLLSHHTGEVTVPQYGVNMLIDDAMIQGLITTKVPVTMLLYRPFDPSSFAVCEAFQRGFINPVTLAVRHPATGQFMSLESALTTGLLQPRASTSGAPMEIGLGTVRKEMATHQQSRTKPKRSESMSRIESERQRRQRNGGTLHGKRQPLLVQSQEYNNYNSQTLHHGVPQHVQLRVPQHSSQQVPQYVPHQIPQHHMSQQVPQHVSQQVPQHVSQQLPQHAPSTYSQTVGSSRGIPGTTSNLMVTSTVDSGTLTLNNNNKSGSHLVNGKLYAATPGYIINSNGQVVNLTDGEVLSLQNAQKFGIVQRLSDNEHQAGQSYVPASNMMFNRNKLEELYEELSRDLHKELQWGKGVEQALASQQGIISTEEYISQQMDEHKHLLEDLHAHKQLARTIVYQNEQLRDQEVSILAPEEIYEQDSLHSEMTSRLETIIKEVENRVKHLSNCLEEVIKLNTEKVKLEQWLQDAESTLGEMHRRTNQLSRLRDVTDRYKAFTSEVIARQADLRFLDLTAHKYVSEANNYKKCLMAFKAQCQGTRSSLIVEDENYTIKEDVSNAKYRYQQLLGECTTQVDNLNNVSETQRQFNEACDRLESWLQMAEKNLGALKREPIKTDHLGLQEQLDRVRDFSNAVAAQEKLIDDLRVQGQLYSEALALTRVDGRHVEDIHETVNDLNCRHGLVAAEALARANILNTAMVQSQGLTASIDALISSVISTDSTLSAMKPVSLNLENLEEQVSEFKLFESEVESHKNSVEQINEHTNQIIHSCSPSSAAIIDSKLQELNQKSAQLMSACRERARDIKNVYSDLQEFNSRSSELTQWLLVQMETLQTADNDTLNAEQLKVKVETIQSQVELKKCSYDAMLSLGKVLRENPRTGQVTSVKDTLHDLQLTWSEFESALQETREMVTNKEEEKRYYDELLGQVTNWMDSMERRIEVLEPVAMDIQLIEQQIESIQPLMNEYEDHSSKLLILNQVGEKCGGLIGRVSSPSRKTSTANRRRLSSRQLRHSLSAASTSSVSTSGVTNGNVDEITPTNRILNRDSLSSVFAPDDLSEVQRELLEVSHRYELIGERLTDRQGEMESTLSGLKSYLMDVQQLMVYLNRAEPLVGEEYTPRDAADAKRKLDEYRRFNEDFQSKGVLLEQLRQRVYELTANRESVPGMLDIETQLAQLEDRWKGIQQASLSRCMSLEGIEANLAQFTDSANFLSTWLHQKEKMLSALGPIATEPNMVKSQLHQVQVLDDELRTQQTRYDHCLECGLQILEKTPADSEQTSDINKRLDGMAKHWNALETQIKSRRDNLKAVLDNSGDLYDTLGYINEWLSTATDKVNALGEEKMDTQTEATMIKKLKAEVEKNEKMVKYAQDLSRKLVESVKQPVAEAEIKQKMMAVSRPFNELKRKLGVIESDNDSKTAQQKAINAVCDDMLTWLKSASLQLQTPLPLSAKDDVLKEQIRSHQSLQNELVDREGVMKQLKAKTDKLQSMNACLPADIESKMAAVTDEWKNVSRNAERRDTEIRAVASQSDQFVGDVGKLVAWLDMTEEKIASLSTPSEDKAELEGRLREAQALQSEIARKKPELTVLVDNAQEFLSSVDADKEAVTEQTEHVQKRWQSVEKLADDTSKSLEEKSNKLCEQQDLINDISKQVKEYEDILASHNALGANAYDSKHMEHIKRPSVHTMTDAKTLLSAQSQLRMLRPQLEAVNVAEMNGHPTATGDSAKPRILKESEELLSRFDALDANIDTWVGQVESASKQVKEFQGVMKVATAKLSDLDDSLDGMKPVSCDSKTIRQQMEEIVALETELASKEDTMAQLETQCRKLTHAGYIQEPQLHKAQIESMKKQIARLQSKASQRHNNLVNKLDEVDKFDVEIQSVQRDMAKAIRAEKSLKPVASDLQTIKQQQQEFKEFIRNTVDPLRKRVDDINKAGLQLIRTAGGSVPTENIEADLDAVNSKWSKLAEQVEDRDKKLDTALLQTGKYKDSVSSLLEWLSETEGMVANQKPPSAEYKVAKAQVQEQKFLQKMINDRVENVEAVQEIAAQIHDQTDARERQQVKSEVGELMQRWQNLTAKVNDRSKALDENLDITKTFHDGLEPFTAWMDKAERKQSLAAPIAADIAAMEQQKREQQQYNSEVEAKATELGAVMKRGQDLLRRCHGDDATIVQDKLTALENRYSDLEKQGKGRLNKIETAMPIAENFQTSCGRLLEWLDRVVPVIESTKVEKASESELLSRTQALQRQLSEIEPVFQVVVSEGASLTRLVPGEGAEKISQTLAKTQKQFSHISDQILKKVETQKAAQEMKQELEKSIEELADWFTDATTRISNTSPCNSDPDELRQKLQKQRMLNDELAAQKGRLKQLSHTAKKLQRDGLILESPALNDRLESVKIQADSLSRVGVEQLGQVEQIIPHAAQFRDLHEDIVGWLDEAEKEVQVKAVTPDQIRERQQVTKALAQDVTDHKPFIDRLSKVGPNLARLCKDIEAGDVTAKLENVLDRYQSLKSAVRNQGEQLREKDQQVQKFSDTVEDITSDLHTKHQSVTAAAPIAAKPSQLREQLEANKAIIDSMDLKLGELELVKADADRMIGEAGGVEDESVRALKDKISNLSQIYSEVKRATEERNAALEQTLDVSEEFWTGLDDVKWQMQDLSGSLDTQDKPALDPDHIKEQQEELKTLQDRLRDMEGNITDVSGKGDQLSGLVGESEQPIVSSSVQEVHSDYGTIKNTWNQRYADLQSALQATNKFQFSLVDILNWLQGKEEQLASLGSVPGDTKSVKAQIEALKDCTSDVNDKYLEVESLNQQAANMVKDRLDTEVKVIKQPMFEVNKRWKSLLDGIGTRKTKLQDALLSLGQFQTAVAELSQWLDRTEQVLAEEDLSQPNVRGDPKIIEIELAKHKILLNDVQSHQSSIDQVNFAGQQVISSEGGAEASTTRENLDKLNQRWQAVLSKTKNWQLNLEDALREALEYQSALNDMVRRLSEIDGQLSTSKPVGGLPETTKEQLEEFMETYNELEQAQPKVAQLIQSGEDLLEKGNEVSAQALQQNLDNLKTRWDLVTSRATEKKDLLEKALQKAEKFHEDQASFINWLGKTEKSLDKLKPSGCTLDTMQTQIAAHKELSHDVTVNKERLHLLDKTSTHLLYFSQKSDATLIKNTQLSLQSRWEKVLYRLAERSRTLDRALKDAKSFNDYWTDLCQWLDNSDQLLDNGQMSNNDPDKIKSQIGKHKEFQRALGSKQPTYDLVMKQGKELLVKSADDGDTQTIGAMLTSLKSKWTNVCGKSVDRQRKLEESLLFSGQFKDALQALLAWLCKIEPFISDEQNVHGDLDTVTKLAEQQKVFQSELSKRASNMAQVRDTAKDLIEKSEDSMPELQSQLIDLTTSWDKVTKQAERRQTRIQDAFQQAEEFSRRANSFLEWVSDCEHQLRLDPERADDETALQTALDEHKAFIGEVANQRQMLSDTLRLGDDILSRSHQEAVPIMKKWLIILRQHMENVDTWSANFERSIQDSLDSIRNSSSLIEELLGWLASSESTLAAMEEDPLPPESSVIEEMLREHQEFEAEISSRQSEVDRLTKPKRRTDSRSGAATPTGRRSSAGTPSGRRSKADLRRTSQTPEPAFKNPRVQALSVKWRQVWLMTMDRRRRLQDALDQQRERAKLRNFNFDDWKKRYMNWMDHNKTRVMDFFRRIDKDRDGKVSRDEFVSGILQSKFPTSQPELEAVADRFDKNKDGYIDYKEFMMALRTEIEIEKEKKSDAERIHDEVEKQVKRCCCQKQFAIQKVSDNKYVFGESQKLRLVRILRSTVMVRVGGGWQALDEFLVKNDPCRVCSWSPHMRRSSLSSSGTTPDLALVYFLAKGRTNTELREKFILSQNVVGQGMSSFTNRPSTSSRLSGGPRSGSTTPVTHQHGHYSYGHSHTHHHTHTTPVQRGTTPDREVSAIMSHKARESPSYGFSGGGANSLSSSRASSRCSEISEDAEAYPVRDVVNNNRTTPSGPSSSGLKSRIPLSRNSSIKKPLYY